MADNGQEIIVPGEAREVQTTAPAALTPFELLDRALARGDDLSIVEKLMDLQERHEKRQAKKAFDAAVAEAKKKIPVIKTNKTGNNQKRYADQGAFAAVVDPIIAEFGLSYRYRAEQDANLIRVTCVLSHRDGYSEETSLSSAPDGSGSKNSIQAIGSALTYLQRYSLKLALGLAASEDDDGKSADGDELISQEELDALRLRIDGFGATFDVAKFCEYLKVDALPDLRKSQIKGANAALDNKAKAAKGKKTEAAQ